MVRTHLIKLTGFNIVKRDVGAKPHTLLLPTPVFVGKKSRNAGHKSKGGTLQPFSKIHYYAFLLDAFARFPKEGWQSGAPLKIRAERLFGMKSGRRSKKHFIGAVVSRLKKQEDALDPKASIVAEFGVYEGKSISELARLFPDLSVHGFDSFASFPDDGRADWQKDFSVDSLPLVPENVKLVKGYFEDTLPEYEKSLPVDAKIKLAHIDCDIYSSTRTIFETLKNRFVPGSIILFDELINYQNFVENEFLAFYEFLLDSDFEFEWFAKRGKLVDLHEFFAGNHDYNMSVYRKHGYYQFAAIKLIKGRSWLDRVKNYEEDALQLARQRTCIQKLSPTLAQA